MRKFALCVMMLSSALYASAQQTATNSAEKRSALTEAAVALDGVGASALEATLSTTTLNGAPETPVTNIRVVVKNSSAVAYSFVSGLVTFYDSASVRCGEGIFKADAVAVNESFETDTPGIRIRCTPVSWRIVATNLLPRIVPLAASTPLSAATRSSSKLIISVDGEQHPIQLDKPMILSLGDRQSTIIVRQAPW
jgi:hypothetical protein